MKTVRPGFTRAASCVSIACLFLWVDLDGGTMSETVHRDAAREIHSSEDVRDGLARCFLRNGADRPQWLADLAAPIVREVLEERDAEIARLRGHSCCDHEGWYDSRCACCNRKAAAEVKNGSGELARYVLVRPKRNPATGASG
jgi:hypothetical protein